MASPKFNRDFEPHHGRCVTVAPGIRRIVAPNPSAFTFHGTGTYILGEGHVAVIDPGPLNHDHLAAITAGLGEEVVEAILITHTHLDHSPLAEPLKKMTGAPTYGFGPHGGNAVESVEEGADRDFVPDHALKDGDVVSGNSWQVEAVHTPGHTSNHLCFASGNDLFCGDHVMGWSTTVVSPPDGDMQAYMESLAKLQTRSETTYYPTHGNPISNPHDHVATLIDHRLQREAQILSCLDQGLHQLSDMVPRMYQDVPVTLHRAAAQSVFAHLLRMVADGRVQCSTSLPKLESHFTRA